MINGDHAQPAHTHPHPDCPDCRDRGWIDDMSTAVRYLRRCPSCADERQPVSASR
jgi:hypothetical protein